MRVRLAYLAFPPFTRYHAKAQHLPFLAFGRACVFHLDSISSLGQRPYLTAAGSNHPLAFVFAHLPWQTPFVDMYIAQLQYGSPA